MEKQDDFHCTYNWITKIRNNFSHVELLKNSTCSQQMPTFIEKSYISIKKILFCTVQWVLKSFPAFEVWKKALSAHIQVMIPPPQTRGIKMQNLGSVQISGVFRQFKAFLANVRRFNAFFVCQFFRDKKLLLLKFTIFPCPPQLPPTPKRPLRPELPSTDPFPHWW